MTDSPHSLVVAGWLRVGPGERRDLGDLHVLAADVRRYHVQEEGPT